MLEFLPSPANTGKLFLEHLRNELGISWIFLNIQAKVELGFSRNSNFIFPAGSSSRLYQRVELTDIKGMGRVVRHGEKGQSCLTWRERTELTDMERMDRVV